MLDFLLLADGDTWQVWAGVGVIVAIVLFAFALSGSSDYNNPRR